MKLYHCPKTRSERAMWMFRELGVQPEIVVVNLFQGENRTPEFLAVNPNGFVPVLVDGDVTLVESSAILMHLADKFADKKLAPAVGTRERAMYYQFMVYGPGTVDPACEIVAYHTAILPEPHRVPAAAEYGRRRFKRIAKALHAMLGGRQYVLGDAFSAADIMIGSGLVWADRFGMLEDSELRAYVERLKARSAFGAE